MQMWELVARERIRDTLTLYNWSGDAGRIEDLTQTFCPDGELEVRGTAALAGRTAIAEFLQGHASELHLYDVIWRQHIWTPERASEGWRAMEDHGSSTANHYDHVHVSVY